MSLHLSKYRIVGNHMSWLISLLQSDHVKERKARPVSVEEKMEEQLQEFETFGDSQTGTVTSSVR